MKQIEVINEEFQARRAKMIDKLTKAVQKKEEEVMSKVTVLEEVGHVKEILCMCMSQSSTGGSQ